MFKEYIKNQGVITMPIAPCYYLPKQLFTSEYKDFSPESKMLFGMIFTNANSKAVIKETSRLIESINDNTLNNMRLLYAQLQEQISAEKEGA